MLGNGSGTEWSNWQTGAVRRWSLLSLVEIFWQLATKLWCVSTGQEENTDEFSWVWKKECHWHQTNPLGQISNSAITMSMIETFLKSSVLTLEKIISFLVLTLEHQKSVLTLEKPSEIQIPKLSRKYHPGAEMQHRKFQPSHIIFGKVVRSRNGSGRTNH